MSINQLSVASKQGSWSLHARQARNRGSLAYGLDFLNAAAKAGSPLVRAYLFGHALELLLKTYLLHQGVGARKLKDQFGHRLAPLVAECRVRGLEDQLHFTQQLVDDIAELSEIYSSKNLQYFSLLFLLAPPRIPDLRRIRRFAIQLSEILRTELRPA